MPAQGKFVEWHVILTHKRTVPSHRRAVPHHTLNLTPSPPCSPPPTHSCTFSHTHTCTKDDDPVCPRCSRSAGDAVCTPHTKQLNFWRCPPVLILTLKRFKQVGRLRQKLTSSVLIPLQGPFDFSCDECSRHLTEFIILRRYMEMASGVKMPVIHTFLP